MIGFNLIVRKLPIATPILRFALACLLILSTVLMSGCSSVEDVQYHDITKTFSSAKLPSKLTNFESVSRGDFDNEFVSPPIPYGFGHNDYTYWYSAKLPKEKLFDEENYLEIPYPVLDEINVYFVNKATNEITHFVAGMQVENKSRLPKDGLLIFPIPKSNTQDFDIYISTQTVSTVAFTAIIWEKSAWEASSQYWFVWQLFLWGGIFVLVLFNLFLATALKDLSYLYYVLYLVGLTLINSTLSGAIDLNLNSELVGHRTLQYVIAITIVFDALFINRFLHTRTNYPKTWYVSIVGMIVLGSPVLVSMIGAIELTAMDNYLVMFVTLGSNFFLIYYFVISIVAYFNGMKQARFVILAFFSFFTSYAFFRLYTFQYLDYGPYISHLLEIGTLLEGLLLSLALADRINLLEQDKKNKENELSVLNKQFTLRLVEAQETERKAISDRLYHQIDKKLKILASRLRESNAVSSADTACSSSEASVENERIADPAKFCESLLQDVRVMSHELHPHLLRRMGLQHAIESTLETAFGQSETEWQTIFETIPSELDSEREIVVYRIVQSCIKHLLSHTETSEVLFSLRCESNAIVVNIKDDGLPSKDTLAVENDRDLNGIYQYVDLFGGRFDFVEDKEGGSHFSFQIPFA